MTREEFEGMRPGDLVVQSACGLTDMGLVTQSDGQEKCVRVFIRWFGSQPALPGREPLWLSYTWSGIKISSSSWSVIKGG